MTEARCRRSTTILRPLTPQSLARVSVTMPDYGHPKRLTEITKCIPVIFVIAVISVLYVTYIFCHCLPMMQLDVAPATRDHERAERAQWQLMAFIGTSTMLIVCLVRSIMTSPGEIPDTSEWIYYGDQADEAPATVALTLHETKKSGERRHCKWCSKYKPDRCHHCRVCRKCILKMDHHCPWIYNCVGYYNHKFFFLLLFYVFCSTHLITWTMAESVKRAVDRDFPFWDMFVLLFGETLCVFLTVLVTAFFGFHIWLMCKAMTTIEFCEKAYKKSQFLTSAYHRGCFGDFQEVLGRNPLIWLLPIHDESGDGLSFVNEGTRLTVDLDVGRQIKKTIPRRSRLPALASAAEKPDEDRYQAAPTTANFVAR